MSSGFDESLSAAMDGEARPFELRRVLDEVSRDDELRHKWNRLHVARAVMRDEAVATEAAAARLAAALDREDEDQEPSRPWFRVGLTPALAAAVAALAAVAVVLIAEMGGSGVAREQVADAAAPSVAAPTPVPGTVTFAAQGQLTAPEHRLVNSYMLRHAHYSATTGTAGIPLARVLAEADSRALGVEAETAPLPEPGP